VAPARTTTTSTTVTMEIFDRRPDFCLMAPKKAFARRGLETPSKSAGVFGQYKRLP
jgi:hypothetical protein